MAGKIFYRERNNAEKGSQTPRFRVVAVSDLDLMLYAGHFRKKEIQKLAKEAGAKLVLLKRDKNAKSKKK